MNIEIEKEDIIKELGDNYLNDVVLLYEIVDKTTTNWDSYRDLTIMLLKNLKSNDELNGDLENVVI